MEEDRDEREQEWRWALVVSWALIATVAVLAVLALKVWPKLAFGTIGEWFAGVATIGAVVVAVNALRTESRRHENAQLDDRDTQARMVWIDTDTSATIPMAGSFSNSVSSTTEVKLVNSSSVPIRNVLCTVSLETNQGALSVAAHSMPGTTKPQAVDGGLYVSTLRLGVMRPGGEGTCSYDSSGGWAYAKRVRLEWLDPWGGPRSQTLTLEQGKQRMITYDD